MDHSIYALDAGSGELLWKSEDMGGALAGTPALSAEGKLYAGTLVSELVVVDADQNGNVSESLPAEGWIWAGPALVDEVLYYGDMAGTLYALETATISPKWTPYRLDGSPDGGFLDILSKEKLGIAGTPLVAQDTVYFGSESGVFTALNTDSGTKRWDKQFEGKLFPGPVGANETILVAQLGKDELLFALDYDGSQKWSFIPRK
jgi:outer membrane protein assembly factor BamB